ncbi:unnamed protein product [Brachionus calyciflorus]|uniref:Rubicon Homology domain-containing protein n=1 Tax=Brachionus calyciflorus TaxID=104777 RepID=A0A813MXY2_9BILA|nr:unnamed protein product [Brachionus calyciflorus]
MLDIPNLIKCQDLKRKALLLKCLKTTFESLMFNKRKFNSQMFTFNGNLSLFVKDIIEILIDGLIESETTTPYETLWNLVTSILLDSPSPSDTNPKNDFKIIFENLNFSDTQSILPDWILNSLRNQTFLNQIKFLFNSETNLLFKSCYYKSAFVLDEDFLSDFFIYLKSYESSNLEILHQCKLNLYKLLNSETDLSRSVESSTSSSYFLIETPSSLTNGHRRIHSYPIQLSRRDLKLDDFSETLVTEETVEHNLIEHFLNDRVNDTESPLIENNPLMDANVFDFINELQQKCECSPLDRENSHFLMADLAIATSELIKSQQDTNPKPKTSSPINIRNNIVNNNIHHKNSFNSPIRSQSFSKLSNFSFKLSSSRITTRSSSSLTDLYSYDNSNISEIFSKFKELKIKESKASSTRGPSSDMFKFSADSSSLMSSIRYFNQSSIINQDGFDIVETKSRSRKFSWETSDLIDTAGAMATRLIQNLLKDSNFKAPILQDFEFFIQFLQYEEIMHEFNFNQNFKSRNKKLTSSLQSNKSLNLSASSIYLSHLEHGQSDSLSRLSVSPISFLFIDSDVPRSASSYQSVKECALKACQKKEIGEALPSVIIGDESWAPVREQLILNNLTTKKKRVDQIKEQHFRCADCGIQLKDTSNKYLKQFNYCEYFSKYFCRCCHINQTSYIPAYVVCLLDLRTNFQVCKKAKKFLDNIYTDPLIPLENLNPSLFKEKSQVFSKIKKLRFKLNNAKSYIKTCRYAQQLDSDLYSKFDDFIINDTQVYSIQSIFKIKKSNFYDDLKMFYYRLVEHIKQCELCSQKGYICGICNRRDLLYPFDTERVEKCPNCLACYHRDCFDKSCPRCIRLKSRAKN